MITKMKGHLAHDLHLPADYDSQKIKQDRYNAIRTTN